jgi:hypothetical protein
MNKPMGGFKAFSMPNFTTVRRMSETSKLLNKLAILKYSFVKTDNIKKWKPFTTKSQITSIQRERVFFPNFRYSSLTFLCQRSSLFPRLRPSNNNL